MAALAAARSSKTAKSAGESVSPAVTQPSPETLTATNLPQKKTELKQESELAIVDDAHEQDVVLNIATVAPLSTGSLDWPSIVRQLELRGMAQQLATQSELLRSHEDGGILNIELRVPVDTLLSSGSVDKLTKVLAAYLNKKVSITTEIGAVRQTAHAANLAEQAERLQLAEQTLESDPFVQTLKREFGATMVPGSVRPI